MTPQPPGRRRSGLRAFHICVSSVPCLSRTAGGFSPHWVFECLQRDSVKLEVQESRSFTSKRRRALQTCNANPAHDSRRCDNLQYSQFETVIR